MPGAVHGSEDCDSPVSPRDFDAVAPSLQRAISFAAADDSSPEPDNRRLNVASLSNGDLSEWNDIQEERLVKVQAELRKAQRRWSESQDFWLREEQDLLALRRRHKKAQKSDIATRKAASHWMTRTFGRAKQNHARPRRKSSGDSMSLDEAADSDLYGEQFEGTVAGEQPKRRISLALAIKRRLSLSTKSSGSSSPVP